MKFVYRNVSAKMDGESQLPFGHCCLTLQPTKSALASPQGWIFDRDAVVEYLAEERDELQRKRRNWDEDQKPKVVLPAITAKSVPSVNREISKRDVSSSFWVNPTSSTSSTPSSGPRPDIVPRCPMSGEPLRFRELVPVNFEYLNGVFSCALTKRPITNQQAVLLKPSGVVMLESAFNQSVASSMICPISDSVLLPSDVIKLQTGGTGFSSHSKVEVKLNRQIPNRSNEGATRLMSRS